MAKSKKKKEGPSWICGDCGKKYGTLRASVCTWHNGKCDYHKHKGKIGVTAIRNFGYPKLPE